MKKTSKSSQKSVDRSDGTAVLIPSGTIRVTEDDILERLLDVPDPRKIVQGMSHQDYYWLVKNADDEWFALIALGSERQWQYLLDLDLWDRDRVDPEQLKIWMERYAEADPDRFVAWLFKDGLSLAYTYLHQMVEVMALAPDEEERVIPEGFFTLDGSLYVRPREEESYPVIHGILEAMARLDLARYEWILISLAGTASAELEEEMYHFRNARLADDGFLPFDEALALYVPLDPDILESDGMRGIDVTIADGEEPLSVPRLPIARAASGGLLGEALNGLSHDPVMDRLCLEFAGLANRIIAADGLAGRELDHMVGAAEKAGGHVNLALEHLVGDDVALAEAYLRRNPVESLFRAGYGLVDAVVREARDFVRESWFRQAGISLNFWGEAAELVLNGLMSRRPRYYDGSTYREFEGTGDLESCRTVLGGLIALDGLFSRLDQHRLLAVPADMTYSTVLITLYARRLTGAEPEFGGISLSRAGEFLNLLREGEPGSPYFMKGRGERFVEEFLGLVSETAATSSGRLLAHNLASVWHEFQDEYENVEAADLSPRYSRLIFIVDEGDL